jgi:hypothetical protein
MFSCCKKQKKINNGFDRKSSNGELIFEDIHKIRAIMLNNKIESTNVNRVHTQ